MREDELTLIGFATDDELDLFHKLITVSGVGPKLALSVLSTWRPTRSAWRSARSTPRCLPVSPASASAPPQKIVLDLKDKMGEVEVSEGLAALTEADAAVIDALTALGYSIVEAQRAVQALPRDLTDVEERLRRALASFGLVARPERPP